MSKSNVIEILKKVVRTIPGHKSQNTLTIPGLYWCEHMHAAPIASSPGSFLKNGGRREPGNICEKSCRLPARHHSCDQRRTLLL